MFSLTSFQYNAVLCFFVLIFCVLLRFVFLLHVPFIVPCRAYVSQAFPILLKCCRPAISFLLPSSCDMFLPCYISGFVAVLTTSTSEISLRLVSSFLSIFYSLFLLRASQHSFGHPLLPWLFVLLADSFCRPLFCLNWNVLWFCSLLWYALSILCSSLVSDLFSLPWISAFCCSSLLTQLKCCLCIAKAIIFVLLIQRSFEKLEMSSIIINFSFFITNFNLILLSYDAHAYFTTAVYVSSLY